MTTTTSTRPRLTPFRQAMLSLFWFGSSVHWTAILIITLPQQALLIGGDAVKGTTLAQILLLGAFVSMVVAPIFGAISDRLGPGDGGRGGIGARIVARFGRRRPWIVAGTLLNLLGLLGMAYFPRSGDLSSLPLYIAAFVWVQFWNNVATAPYAALIPDVVHPEQRGSASGWYGLMNMLGSFVGGITGLLFTSAGQTDAVAIYYFVGAILLLSMLGTVLFVKEPPVRAAPQEPFSLRAFVAGLASPLRDHDFRWVFWTRMLMIMGTFTVQEYLQYYMRDVVRQFTVFGTELATNAESAVSFFILALLVGAVASSLAGGVLSDRIGRKAMVYISSLLQGIVPLLMIRFQAFGTVVGLGVIFGLGYGAYTSVDWALASDVLPSEKDHARDMGVWHVADTLPQVLATPIAGLLLDRFQAVGSASGRPNLGYTAIFSLAVLYFVLGTVLVRRIRKVR